MRTVGFSTGALSLGDFRLALHLLERFNFRCIELSALRISEIQDLVEAIPFLNLKSYSYVSLHAPSSYTRREEKWIADLLFSEVHPSWPIVLHPDAIIDFDLWRPLRGRLAIENMDRRKHRGRTVLELDDVFAQLPDARLCLDLGHARQCDSSMTEAYLMLRKFSKKLVQIHLSEVNTESRHDPISFTSQLAFQQMAYLIPEDIPIILESRVLEQEIEREMQIALETLDINNVHEEYYA